MKLYLVTGFLGAGKTCLIKNLIKLWQDKKLFIIINEFGREGVDGTLIAQTGAALEEINNGSIFCQCKFNQFEKALQNAVDCCPDIILVEASGLADPGGIRALMARPEYSGIQWMGGICLVDAARFESVAKTARVIARQLAVSGLALVNKTDIATAQQLETTLSLVQQMHPGVRIETTTLGNIQPQWLDGLNTEIPLEQACHKADITLQKKCITLDGEWSKEKLNALLLVFIEDSYRVKGFVKAEDGVVLVDCVGPVPNILPWHGDVPESVNKLVILAGAGMPLRKSLKTAKELYTNRIISIE